MRRLADIEDNLRQDLRLLADYEHLLRLATDPIERMKYQSAIDRLKSSIASSESEKQDLLSSRLGLPETTAEPQSSQPRMIITRDEREMVLVAGGQFLFGAERTIVFLPKPYYIDRYPVTNADYRHFLDQTQRPAPGHWPDGALLPGSERHPAVGLTYSEALCYAEWTGRRLPTEQEWEKATRGTDGRLWPYGHQFVERSSHPIWRQAYAMRSTTDVGLFTPHGDSPYGVGDVGHVWEWTSTWYEYRRYKAVRGGAWRDLNEPALVINRSFEDDRAHDVGFRCVCDVAKVGAIIAAVISN